MSMFTLSILADGHAILSTDRDLSMAQVENLRRAYKQWQDTPDGLAIIARLRIEHVSSVEIDLPDPVPA